MYIGIHPIASFELNECVWRRRALWVVCFCTFSTKPPYVLPEHSLPKIEKGYKCLCGA